MWRSDLWSRLFPRVLTVRGNPLMLIMSTGETTRPEGHDMTSSKPTQEITITVPITFRVDKYDLTYTYAGETLSSTVEENIAGYVLDHLDTTGIARYIKDFLESYEGKDILTDAISANDDSVDAALPDGYKEAHEADMRAEEADGSGYAITDNIELLDKALANA